jgi:5-methylthioadenosine/S-adenosylhomocysteine deaminase
MSILLTADVVLTMDAANRVITKGGVLVCDDKIAQVGTEADLVAQAPGAERRSLGKAVLMPGLINAHCHSGFLRGTAEGLPLWEWLRFHIDPMHRVLQPADAEAASWLCYGESLLAGTTTVVDMWRFMSGSARAAEQLGIRVVMVPYVGEAKEFDYFDTLDQNEKLIVDWNGAANGRINVWVGVEHQLYFTPEACKRAVALCERYNVGLHTHTNESRVEILEIGKRYGLLPVQALEKFGLLDPERVLLAHCIWLDAAEISLIQKHGAGVVHNPSSNMKLASGAAPVEVLIDAGIAVGIGTDGEKENNNLDLLEEMKIASLLAKFHTMRADALDSWHILRSATIEGARAIGMADRIGSLEPGKQADIIAIRGDNAHMTPFITEGPFFNIHHNIVHAVQGSDVVMTMVDGVSAARDGILLTGDIANYIGVVETVFADVVSRRAAWLKEHSAGAHSPID